MKLIFMILVAVISINILTNASALAVGIEFPDLALSQSFRFNADAEKSFGHLISLQIGSTVFNPDIDVVNPATKAKYSIVGALSSYSWKTGLLDPMELSFSVSKANSLKIKDLLSRTISDATVVFNFQIFSVDPASKELFIAVKSFTFARHGILNKIGKDLPSLMTVTYPVQGTLQKIDNKFQIAIENKPNTVVKSPINFKVRVAIAPTVLKQQDVVRAISPTEREKFPWGRLE